MTTKSPTATLLNQPQSTYWTFDTVQTPSTVELEEVRVDMADLKASSKPVQLVTSVGSCIAICIHDLVSRSGGMAHIMLPHAAAFMEENLPAKYADSSIPALVKEIKKINAKPMLTAKIAGGANMFPSIQGKSIAVGAKNIDAVRNTLYSNNITLRAEDVGGTQGRKVTFNTMTGTVTVRLINGVIRKL